MTILGMLAEPLQELGTNIGTIFDFMVSMKRLQKFLLVEERNESMLGQPSDDTVAVQINGGNYWWGLPSKKDDDSDDGDDDEQEDGVSNLQGSSSKEPSRESKKKKMKKSKSGKKKKKNSKSKVKSAREEQPEDDEAAVIGVQDDDGNSDFSDCDQEGGSSSEEDEIIAVDDLIVLKDLNLKIRKGSFVCIIGEVGSGKTSLLSTMLDDLRYMNDDFLSSHGDECIDEEATELKGQLIDENNADREEAPVLVGQNVAFVQQVPWIQNKTIRDNIIFGHEVDEERYQRTIRNCELSRDLEILPAGDMTEIGEKGINLSGG